MIKQYKVETNYLGQDVISYEENGVLYSFLSDPANSDYQAYLAAQSTPIDTEDE
jgi:hypothetical protein